MRRMLACTLLAWSLFAATEADALFEKARSAQLAGRIAEAEAGYRDYLNDTALKPRYSRI